MKFFFFNFFFLIFFFLIFLYPNAFMIKKVSNAIDQFLKMFNK